MKKLYTLAVALFAASAVFGQTQRLCLLEEFTQASCPPCAAQNPALNAMLASNTVKVASIKYQTNWPGFDPMNIQTQSWVGSRVSYYGITGVPNICFDGNVLQKAAPSALTQTVINNRYAVTSPFSFNLTHSFSADWDSVFISLEITCTQATSGTFKGHVALVEKEIQFCSAPGTNGEEDFYGVMRKMYPSAAGTTLPGTWNVGDIQTITFAEAVPSYIYGFNNLAVVGFVQNDANKEVLQTAISEPVAMPDYAILKDCAAAPVPPLSCTSPVTGLTATITNIGSNTLTAADITYSVDGGAPTTYNWTGSIATGSSTSLALPAINYTGNGYHTLAINIATANGAAVPSCNDTRTNIAFTANLTATVPPVTESFATAGFPPAGWGYFDADGDAVTWTRANVGVAGNNGSMKMDFYNSVAGSTDDLYLPAVDMTSVTSAYLTFKINKAPYSGYTDNLNVVSSTDCGTTWTTIWTKSDPTLSTVAATTSSYTATTAIANWRTDTVDLTSLAGQASVILGLRAVSGYGNNAFIDDVNITILTGVGENALEQQISMFPTPTSGDVFMDLSAIKNNTVLITVSDIAGKVVQKYTAEKSNRAVVSLGNLQAGSYFIQVDADGQRISKKVILNK